jgi:hypothetical protein
MSLPMELGILSCSHGAHIELGHIAMSLVLATLWPFMVVIYNNATFMAHEKTSLMEELEYNAT